MVLSNSYAEKYYDGKCLEFELSNLKRGQGTTIGSFLRRSSISEDSGYKVIAMKIVSGNETCDTLFKSIKGVLDDTISIYLKMQGVSFLAETDGKVGDVVSLNYSGNRELVTVSDLHISNSNLVVVPKGDINDELIHNLGGNDISVELVACWNEGYVTKDSNKLLLTKNGMRAEEFLIYDTTHSKIEKVTYSIEENDVGEKLNFRLELKFGDAKEVISKLVEKLINELGSLKQCF